VRRGRGVLPEQKIKKSRGGNTIILVVSGSVMDKLGGAEEVNRGRRKSGSIGQKTSCKRKNKPNL